MADEYPTVKVAAVQAAPVYLDRDRTLEKACELIAEAGDAGAEVIIFPESFIPGHPLWYHFHSASGTLSQRLATELFKNSVEVPGPVTQRLAQAADDANAYVTMGICEKEPDTTGTMYNSQLYFSPDGELLDTHQKIKPTLGEQLVHADGKNDAFGAFDTEYGPMSGLICGENSNPLAIFALMSEYTRIHAMSWPSCFKTTAAMPEKVRIASQGFAYMSKAYVISATGVVDDRMIELLALDEEEAEAVRSPEQSGGSVIVAPNGEVVAGPLGSEEGILYAELDLEYSIVGKLTHDYAVDYNRPDMFQLTLNRNTPELFSEATSPSTDDPGPDSRAEPLSHEGGDEQPGAETDQERSPDGTVNGGV